MHSALPVVPTAARRCAAPPPRTARRAPSLAEEPDDQVDPGPALERERRVLVLALVHHRVPRGPVEPVPWQRRVVLAVEVPLAFARIAVPPELQRAPLEARAAEAEVEGGDGGVAVRGEGRVLPLRIPYDEAVVVFDVRGPDATGEEHQCERLQVRVHHAMQHRVEAEIP